MSSELLANRIRALAATVSEVADVQPIPLNHLKLNEVANGLLVIADEVGRSPGRRRT